jgi:hypothetical protein
MPEVQDNLTYCREQAAKAISDMLSEAEEVINNLKDLKKAFEGEDIAGMRQSLSDLSDYIESGGSCSIAITNKTGRIGSFIDELECALCGEKLDGERIVHAECARRENMLADAAR